MNEKMSKSFLSTQATFCSFMIHDICTEELIYSTENKGVPAIFFSGLFHVYLALTREKFRGLKYD